MTNGAARRAVAEPSTLPNLAMLVALGIALCVGFALAIVLPSAIVLSAPWGLRWRALVQVHGYAMVVGWLGLFVVGMASRLLPRYSGTPLQFPRLPPLGMSLLTAGIMLRIVAQPLADAPVLRALLPVSAAAALAGVACFSVSAIATLRRPLREHRMFAYFLTAGTLWFAVQALLTLWALARLASGSALAVPARVDTAIVEAQIFGFLLGFVGGVSLRTIPTLYAWKPPLWLLWAALALLQLGAMLTVAGATLGGAVDAAPRVSGVIGRLFLGSGLLLLSACMGVWRRPERLRGGIRADGWLFRSAYVWAALAGGTLCWGVARALERGAPVAGYIDDAARHMLALGLFTMLIVAMAYLVATPFSVERTGGTAAARRLALICVSLNLAAALRAGAALSEGVSLTSSRFWAMALAGVFAAGAIALFARRLVHGLRHPYVAPKPTVR